MENIRELSFYSTHIKELPFSFKNLIGLRQLDISLEGILQLRPSIIVMMPELTEFCAYEMKGLQWLNEEGEEKVSSKVSSKIEILSVWGMELYDDFLPKGFTTWFARVKKLDLSGNNFTILPECFKEFQFLWELNVGYCRHLREIKGIPPSLKRFYAENCESLASSSANIFLKKELHEAGNTFICLPEERIPEWLDHHSSGPSISFWFRNKFPDKILCLVSGHADMEKEYSHPLVFISGCKIVNYYLSLHFYPGYYNTYLFDICKVTHQDSPYDEHFGDEWYHVEVRLSDMGGNCQIYANFGIHIFEQESCMEDVRFTDPYGKRKLDNNLNSLESQNPPRWNKFCTTIHDWIRWNRETSIQPADVYIEFGIIKELTCRRRNELMSSKKWEKNSSLMAKKNRLVEEIRRAKKELETFSTITIINTKEERVGGNGKEKRVGGLVMHKGRATVMCDGAVSYANQKAVCAAVITNHMNRYVGGFAKDLQFMSAIEAQLWGVFYGIRLAIAKGFSYLQIHSDSHQAVNMLQTGIFPPRLSHLGYHINSLEENLQQTSYWHSRRDKNIVAYLFTKHGLSVDNDICFFDSPPRWA